MSHRSAPRNDMQKFATCPQNSWALPVYCRKMSLHPLTHLRLLHTLRAPRPCNRRRVTVFCMSLRTSAHTCGNPFSPQRSLASRYYFGQIRSTFRIRPKYCFLPRLTAGVTDCHVAPLLAMTCRKRQRAGGCNDVVPGEFVTRFVFALGTALRHAPPQELRIVPSLRSSQ